MEDYVNVKYDPHQKVVFMNARGETWVEEAGLRTDDPLDEEWFDYIDSIPPRDFLVGDKLGDNGTLTYEQWLALR